MHLQEPTSLDWAATSALVQVLKLGAMEMTDVRREGESTFVRMVTRPDFGNWVPKGLQSQVNMKNVEFHDVSRAKRGPVRSWHGRLAALVAAFTPQRRQLR